jgi:cell division protein FtsB
VTPSSGRGRRRRLPRALWPAVVSVVLVGVLFLAVFPTRTYLAQRASTSAAEERLRVLREENAALEARVDRLHRDDEIERIAREQYNLVRPGEEAYAVLPPPASTTTTTSLPAAGPRRSGRGAVEGTAGDVPDRSAAQRAWEILTSWL